MTATTDPAWLQAARAYVGTREIPGKDTAPTIQRWLRTLRAWWSDDETPWCGVAVAAWMREAGVQQLPTHWYRAKGWLDWGITLAQPCVGCVAVFEREGGGHVGLVVGTDRAGRLMVLGGNQGNQVREAPFDRLRVIGYRWPAGQAITVASLPLISSSAASSTQEA